jgi:thiamine pyrophosphokinase
MPAEGGVELVHEPGESTAVVLAGGDRVDPALRRVLPDGAAVIAADAGVSQAAVLDVRVDLVVGDLDSVAAAELDAAVAAGAIVERHPAAKDATDLEIALDAALRLGARHTVVLGLGGGPRLDHFLANALLIAAPRFAPLGITAFMGTARLQPVHAGDDRVVLRGAPGSLVSLLALGDVARGVTTEGLVYPLAGEDLHPGSTRGVSNEMVGSSAAVMLTAGVVLVVQPFDAEP